MSDVADYDADILLWSERQAALLRGLKDAARGLPNELDLENVAEEIESVGRSEFRAAESLLALIIGHGVKVAFASSPDPVPHWLSEIRNFHGQYLLALTPAMRDRFDLQRIWRKTVKRLSEDMADRGETLPALAAEPPFDIAFFEDDAFDARTLAPRIQTAAIRETAKEGGGE